MADIGEMTEKKLRVFKKRREVDINKLGIKKDELEIRKLELEDDMEVLEIRIKEVQELIRNKNQELKELGG